MPRFTNRYLPATTLLPVLLLMYCFPVRAISDDIRSERIQLPAGTDTVQLEAQVQGDETVDYLLAAQAGQPLSVNMHSDNGANYFNLMAPGETVVAFYNGSIDGNTYQGTLGASGDFRIRVYLMRSAARRNETAHFDLVISLGEPGAARAGTQAGAVPGQPDQ